MRRRTKLIGAAATVIAAAGIAGTGIAVAGGGGDDDASDTAITGAAYDRASAAALDYTGGGRVTGSEVGDEEGAYEVEVTLADGRSVDVHLDRDFRVIGSKGDRDRPGADDPDHG